MQTKRQRCQFELEGPLSTRSRARCRKRIVYTFERICNLRIEMIYFHCDLGTHPSPPSLKKIITPNTSFFKRSFETRGKKNEAKTFALRRDKFSNFCLLLFDVTAGTVFRLVWRTKFGLSYIILSKCLPKMPHNCLFLRRKKAILRTNFDRIHFSRN